MANLLNTYLHNFFHFWALRFSFNLCVLSFQCPHATCVLYIHKGAAPLFPPSSALHMPIWILCMFHQEKMLRMWDFLLLLTAPRICTCSNTQMTCMLFACLGMLLLCRCCCHFSYLWISETKAIAKQCAWLTQVWISHADSMYRHKQLHKPIQNSQPCTLHTQSRHITNYYCKLHHFTASSSIQCFPALDALLFLQHAMARHKMQSPTTFSIVWWNISISVSHTFSDNHFVFFSLLLSICRPSQIKQIDVLIWWRRMTSERWALQLPTTECQSAMQIARKKMLT